VLPWTVTTFLPGRSATDEMLLRSPWTVSCEVTAAVKSEIRTIAPSIQIRLMIRPATPVGARSPALNIVASIHHAACATPRG
jgi:hypothetical protein